MAKKTYSKNLRLTLAVILFQILCLIGNILLKNTGITPSINLYIAIGALCFSALNMLFNSTFLTLLDAAITIYLMYPFASLFI